MNLNSKKGSSERAFPFFQTSLAQRGHTRIRFKSTMVPPKGLTHQHTVWFIRRSLLNTTAKGEKTQLNIKIQSSQGNHHSLSALASNEKDCYQMLQICLADPCLY